MANTNKYFIASDTVVRIVGLADENDTLLTGTTTVTGKLLDSAGAVVIGAEALTFNYDNTPGAFSGVVPAALVLTSAQRYTLELTITMPNSRKLTVHVPRLAGYVEA